jgi:hypothetical protein
MGICSRRACRYPEKELADGHAVRSHRAFTPSWAMLSQTPMLSRAPNFGIGREDTHFRRCVCNEAPRIAMKRKGSPEGDLPRYVNMQRIAVYLHTQRRRDPSPASGGAGATGAISEPRSRAIGWVRRDARETHAEFIAHRPGAELRSSTAWRIRRRRGGFSILPSALCISERVCEHTQPPRRIYRQRTSAPSWEGER